MIRSDRSGDMTIRASLSRLSSAARSAARSAVCSSKLVFMVCTLASRRRRGRRHPSDRILDLGNGGVVVENRLEESQFRPATGNLGLKDLLEICLAQFVEAAGLGDAALG